jgi:Tol biopolymer transport system component
MLRRAGLNLLIAGAVLTGLSCGGADIQAPTTGSIEITSSTTGVSPDPDGYTITLDGTDRGALDVSGGVTLEGLTEGSHTVGLSGVAANCQVQGENPRAVTVTAGASATAAFEVTCNAPPPVTGSIRITTSTTGPDPDANGYDFAVDGGTSQPIGINVTTTLANVAAGAHTVRLSGVAANCTVQGGNSRSVSVSAGVATEVSFAVSCALGTGSIVITTTTTGSPDPDGYTVALDNGTAQAIGTNATLTIPAVSPGAHRVTVGGLATNCRAQGDNTRSVTVTAGATVTIVFSLDCIARIAFTRASEQGRDIYVWDIYVMNADGTDQTRITTGGAAPAWSPDGTRIAFASAREGNWKIYVMNADGTGVRKLTNDPPTDGLWVNSDGSPTWSPDGTRIAFHRYDRGFSEIMVMNADGSGVRQLTTSVEGTSHGVPDWSRDGSRIAFEEWLEGDPADHLILVMNSDGTDQQFVTAVSDVVNTSPAWSTDGRIAFSGYRNEDIYVRNADGTGAVQLTNDPALDLDPAWSRDDKKIAFTRYDYDTQSQGIYIMNADGSGLTRLTNGPDSDPTWSP